MIIELEQKANDIEKVFAQYKSGKRENIGFVKISKKSEKWTINVIKGMGNVHQVNLRWDCWIKDNQLLLRRKMTFDQIIQMVLCIGLSLMELLVIIGFIITLKGVIVDNANFNPLIPLGLLLCSAVVAGLWLLYYFNFYKNANKSVKEILKQLM